MSETSFTNPQLVEHEVAAYGFVLPVYTTSQNTGCPPTAWDPSATTGTYVSHAGLNGVVTEGANKVVKPVNNALHQGYDFYMRITATGVNTVLVPADTIEYQPMYQLKVGCYPDTIVVTEAPGFVANLKMFVGDTGVGLYSLT